MAPPPTWTIPAERIQIRRPHRAAVKAGLAVLKELLTPNGGGNASSDATGVQPARERGISPSRRLEARAAVVPHLRGQGSTFAGNKTVSLRSAEHAVAQLGPSGMSCATRSAEPLARSPDRRLTMVYAGDPQIGLNTPRCPRRPARLPGGLAGQKRYRMPAPSAVLFSPSRKA